MKCRYCGAEIPDDSVFCPECGKTLSPINNEGDRKGPSIKKFLFIGIAFLLLLFCGIMGSYVYQNYRVEQEAKADSLKKAKDDSIVKAKVIAKDQAAANKEAKKKAKLNAAIAQAQKDWETGKEAALSMIKSIYPKLVEDYNANTDECSYLIDKVVFSSNRDQWHDQRDNYPIDPFFCGTGRGYETLRYEGAKLSKYPCVIEVDLYNETRGEEFGPMYVIMKKEQGEFRIFETTFGQFNDVDYENEMREMWS